MTKALIIANWKMNPSSLAEANQLFNSIKKGIKNIKGAEIVICPPFVYLLEFLSRWRKSQVMLGAQDCFWEEKGAFTGEVSATMLKNLDCQYVIIGHSERRKLGESDEMINKKMKAAIKAELNPILCIGETEKERKEGKTFEVLRRQLKKGLKTIGNWKPRTRTSSVRGRLEIGNLVIAYEPVWAIGTGNFCPVQEAEKVLIFLKKLLREKIKILYGGSVNSQNARDYIKKAFFQGLLVGGSSLNPQEFIEIVKNATRS